MQEPKFAALSYRLPTQDILLCWSESWAAAVLLLSCAVCCAIDDRICKQGRHQVIMAGDLNSPPDSLEVILLQQLLPALLDSWACANHAPPTQSELQIDAPAAERPASSPSGATANTADNSFGAPAALPSTSLSMKLYCCNDGRIHAAHVQLVHMVTSSISACMGCMCIQDRICNLTFAKACS